MDIHDSLIFNATPLEEFVREQSDSLEVST